jgi:hypothetical protein
VLHRDRTSVLTFADEAQGRAALAEATAARAQVIAFTPHRRSLEELFVARARAKAQAS